MSTTTVSEVSAAPVVDRARATILATVLSLGALAVAAMVLWQPWGARDHLGYADIAPHRDGGWLGTIVDGLGFAAAAIALGLAACKLAPRRGSVWANVGAILTGFGGVAFCAGIVAFGSFAWYATNTAALSPDAGQKLMDYVQDAPGHLMGLQMAGFLLETVGSLVLMVALWRARSVPRWFPIAYPVLTIALFFVGGVVANIAQAAQMLSLLVVAYATVRAR